MRISPDEPIRNGRLRRWQLVAAVCVAVTAGLSIGTAYAWPFLSAIVHHTQTIIWANELRYNHADLGQEHGRLIDRLNRAPEQDAEIDRMRTGIVEIKLGLGALSAQQAELKGMLEQQERMLQILIQRRQGG